jgi:hypothetical protein
LQLDKHGTAPGFRRDHPAERHAEARMPDRDHWSASMLMRWVLTRDSQAVLSMVSEYGGWLVEGDEVTRIQPHSWDDVVRGYSMTIPCRMRRE